MTTHQALQKILYVDDEADIRAVTRLALEAVAGFRVCVCASGPEALAEASTFAPDLIMLDVMMPGMDGPATLAALRQLPDLRCVPVVFMSAKVQTHEVAQYRELGAIDVIAKPFDPMTLGDQVRAIWAAHER